MSDSTLWAVALGVGALGLVLVIVATVAAVSANARARRSREAPPAPDPRRQTDGSDGARAGGGGWLWLKAGVFAFIHAGAVSFVLGGLTFFEDVARANEEIRTTGTVTFPKRLLPRTLTGPDVSLQLSQVANGAAGIIEARADVGGDPPAAVAETTAPNPDVADWEVVEVVPEETVE
jgi:hypothetical protein